MNTFDAYRERVESFLENWFSALIDTPAELLEAMHYAVFNGGKRMRPLYIYLMGEALGAPLAQLDIPAAAIELMHCYSLVHDDLPAMDNADLRRGKASCHKAFGEATAILVGDALQSESFRILATAAPENLSAAERIQLVRVLAEASGASGMAGGQYLDMASSANTALIGAERIHQLKTGALIRACAEMALIIAQAENLPIKHNLIEFAECTGFAFQVQDDILDLIGNSDMLGKNTGVDKVHDKANYAVLLGLPAAKKLLQGLHDRALTALESLGERATGLAQLCHLLTNRQF